MTDLRHLPAFPSATVPSALQGPTLGALWLGEPTAGRSGRSQYASQSVMRNSQLRREGRSVAKGYATTAMVAFLHKNPSRNLGSRMRITWAHV